MAKNKAVSDEELVAALIQHGTIKEAAAAAGTAPRTFYDRMKDPAFRALYTEAKTDILREAVFSINGKLSEAVDTVAAIMSDTGNNPAVRLQAAQTIINNAAKFSERLVKDETTGRELADPLASFSFF